MIRALVVDDSSFMRKAISMMLERASDITVVDTATNGAAAVEKACELEPDIITMDVEMPKMDGITAVEQIMDRSPTPILMVSSLTEDGADVTVEALRAGAADFIPKRHSNTSLQIREIQDELIEKVHALARSKSRLFEKGTSRTSTKTSRSEPGSRQIEPADQSYEVLVVGSSTGGPLALQRIVPALPGKFPLPVAVVQHMPPHFTRSLAERLNSLSALQVVEASDGMTFEPGTVVVAAGDHHLTFERRGASVVVRTPTGSDGMPHCPSVDVAFRSACDLFQDEVLAVVMTGMGKDGLQGAEQIKEMGGTVYVQDEASSVVYGMPRVVEEAGVADGVFPLEELSDVISQAVGVPALS